MAAWAACLEQKWERKRERERVEKERAEEGRAKNRGHFSATKNYISSNNGARPYSNQYWICSSELETA
jgi:hypothetical protein